MPTGLADGLALKEIALRRCGGDSPLSREALRVPGLQAPWRLGFGRVSLSRLVSSGLEQSHRVPRRVLHQDLLAPHADDDLVPEPGPALPQPGHRGLDVLHLELKPVP